jgi:hypothetical protein
MKRDWRTITAWWVLALGLSLAAWNQILDEWAYAQAADSASASDALPLYLGARAVRWGYDPTDINVLQEMYIAADLHVTRALFSVLYPPSMHVFLQPLAGLSYTGFLYYWRQVLMGVAVLGIAMAGTVGVRGSRVPVAMAASVLGAFVLFPTFIEVQLALGQPNPLVVGVFGLAMGCAARGWMKKAALIAVVGAGVKLVPAIIGWPLLMANRWRAVGVAVIAGLMVLVATVVHVPFERVVANLEATMAFQQAVEPHWLHDHTLGDWARFIGFLRRPSLLVLSLCLVGWSAFGARAEPVRQREVVAIGMGLLSTALAADGAGVGAYYATLAIPGMAVLLSWPLVSGASRWSWVTVAAAFAVFGVVEEGLIYNTPNVEVRLVAACTIIWLGVAIRLCTLCVPWTWRARGIGLGLVAAALVHASIWTWRPPFGGHKTLKEAVPGSQTTPAQPPTAPIPHD